MSANASGERALEAGADRFIAKPFLPSELLAALDEILDSRSPSPEVRQRASERP